MGEVYIKSCLNYNITMDTIVSSVVMFEVLGHFLSKFYLSDPSRRDQQSSVNWSTNQELVSFLSCFVITVIGSRDL